MSSPRRLIVLLLDILGKYNHRDRASCGRDPDCPIDDVTKLRRAGHLLDELGDVREHAVEVQLLLVAGAADRGFRLPRDCEHGHVVELRVVQAGDEMGRPRPAGRQADAELAGELGMGHGHECRHFLVARLDELDLAVTLERADHAVDSVAGIAVDAPDAPALQPVNQEIAGVHEVPNAPAVRLLR